ncbi:hypothetical protein P175DRAFT_0528532 [Aspergillus ochraceoroseus IBT 24754]|uniref:Uncharacterized protein n=1 Tax=Aspergillus ochraceoroseus IBT 24754 TaxID=1392256 RepID=A0A2T5M902_9EURO|nr:uncharacterized protein P175DRAFT_0528532 [Aspergillus ochraceoroseus IBT 24754]PTU25011.1 hypothetical protein P175DRAFT_0528532 [Aspergillus ochraceoroseus IBT 24754]
MAMRNPRSPPKIGLTWQPLWSRENAADMQVSGITYCLIRAFRSANSPRRIPLFWLDPGHSFFSSRWSQPCTPLGSSMAFDVPVYECMSDYSPVVVASSWTRPLIPDYLTATRQIEILCSNASHRAPFKAWPGFWNLRSPDSSMREDEREQATLEERPMLDANIVHQTQ